MQGGKWTMNRAVTLLRSSSVCQMAAALLLLLTLASRASGSSEGAVKVVIDAYPNTTEVEQGTTLVLVCRVVGVPSTTVRMLSYEWTCPGGSCDAGAVDPEWAAKVQQDNILVVNVRNDNDNGCYTCTVDVEDSTTRQVGVDVFTLSVASGLSFLNEDGGLRVFFPNNSFVTNSTLTNTTKSGRPTVGDNHIACYGGDPQAAEVTWHNSSGPLVVCRDGDGPRACLGCGPSCQRNGAVGVDVPLNGTTNIHVFLTLPAYKNQDLQCRVNGGQSAFIGVYLKDRGVNTALQPPSSITQGATTTTTVSVTWSQVSNATGYYVSYQRQDLGSPPVVTPQYERIVGRASTNVTLSGLEPGTTYRIRVWSTNGTSVSGEAREMDVTTVESAPTPPRMLTTAGNTTSSSVELNWLPPLHPNGAIHYEIEYEQAMTPGDPVIAGNSSSPYFTLTLPNEFLTYTVRVAAVNSKGRTNSSKLLPCLGKNRERGPQPPTGVSVDTLSHESVNVSWDAQQSMQCDVVIGNYSVRYQRRNAFTAGYTAVYTNETNVTLQKLEPETNYRVSVTSIASNGEMSAYSNWVQFTTAMATPSQAYPSSSFHVGVVVGAAVGGFVGGVLLTAAIGGCLACAVFRRSKPNPKRQMTAKKEVTDVLYENPQLQANPAYWTTLY